MPEVFRPKNAPPDINTEFALTKGKSSVKPCTRKEGGKNAKVTASLRECHVELVLKDKGAGIRLCTTGGEPGVVIPVKDHREATAVSNAFCGCLKKAGQTRQKCASALAKKRP